MLAAQRVSRESENISSIGVFASDAQDSKKTLLLKKNDEQIQ